MHRAAHNDSLRTDRRGVAGELAGTLLGLASALLTALTEKPYELLFGLLINLAADPYPAGEIYDPSEDYEIAREVLAMENLITGAFGSSIGPGRVMRFLGGIECMPGLAHCTAAMRTTDEGDDVFLAFELDPFMLEDNDGDPAEYSVQIIRTPAGHRWESIDRQEFANATAALICFFSDRPIRIGHD